MTEIVFNTTLWKDGYLFCPKEFLFNEAEYKVIVSLPQNNASSMVIELAAAKDNCREFLTKEELDYYMTLD